ncbi:MAG: hypothetical protein ACXWVJ_01630 [Caulobacteraceae bacterium]
MLPLTDVDKVASRVVNKMLGAHAVEQVASEETQDAEGDDALRVIVVLTSDKTEALDDEAVLDTSLSLQTELQNAGEDRFAYVEYLTKEDLKLRKENEVIFESEDDQS